MATTGTLTSLQAAAALHLFKGQGFSVNSNFSSNVILYSTTGLSSTGGYVASLLTIGTTNIANATVGYTGRFGSYYTANVAQTLGATTIPAITQAIPGTMSAFTGTAPANVVYQMDRACARALGSNSSIDLGYFISTFFSTQGYVTLCNKEIAAITNSATTSFSNYGVTNYQGMVTQGWDKYQIGNALPESFRRIGTMTDSISTGQFGTPNAVAYVLINKGLGQVGNLSAKLTTAEVNQNDLLNSRYTDSISYVLSTITDPAQLTTVQETIGSNVISMTSLLDYTDLAKCAGKSNDSAFASFAEVGADLFKKAHNPSFRSGAEVATLIGLIQNPKDSAIESIAGNNSMLNSTIITELKGYLPISSTEGNVRITDVIGTPSGYYNSNLVAVINGLANLNNTSYGSQITSALNTIVDTINDANLLGSNVSPGIPFVASPPYYGVVSDATDAYEALLTTIVNDSSVLHIVEEINTNYANVCSALYKEFNNWNKAAFYTSSYSDSNSILSFAQSLAQQGQDFSNTGSGQYLSGTVSSDEAGSTIRAVLIEGKNYQRLQAYGISPNGYVS